MLFLMLAVSDEDRSKAERLYYTYRKLMFREAYAVLGCSARAEDAIHTAFIKIIKNLDKLDEADIPRTRSYIMTVLKNTAYDMFNKEKNIVSPEECYEETAAEGSAANPESLVISRENTERITELIMKLPQKYRDAFIMKYARDHSNKEIAELLCITEEAVKKRITRAKAMLGEALKKEGIL